MARTFDRPCNTYRHTIPVTNCRLPVLHCINFRIAALVCHAEQPLAVGFARLLHMPFLQRVLPVKKPATFQIHPMGNLEGN